MNLSTTWHIKRDYDSKSPAARQSNKISPYLRPDISKGITTNVPTARNFSNTTSLSTTWHIKRDYDHPSVTNMSNLSTTYLRPDISKGITTKSIILSHETEPSLSTTWHIKRDYDGVTVTFKPFPSTSLIYDLTYQKGLRPSSAGLVLLLCLNCLSTTWHIKRDYDIKRQHQKQCRLKELIYDLTYQKGLRLCYVALLSALDFLFLSTTWHIKRDYDLTPALNRAISASLIYDLTYQKGLRLESKWCSSDPVGFLSTTWHIKRDYDRSSFL